MSPTQSVIKEGDAMPSLLGNFPKYPSQPPTVTAQHHENDVNNKVVDECHRRIDDQKQQIGELQQRIADLEKQLADKDTEQRKERETWAQQCAEHAQSERLTSANVLQQESLTRTLTLTLTLLRLSSHDHKNA